MDKTRTELGPVDLNSDVPPNERHLVVTTSTQFGLVDMTSDVSFPHFFPEHF